MKLSVIVTAFNNQATIQECLHSFLHQTIPPDQFEIWVVSDGSSDRTNALVKELQPQNSQLHLTNNPENQGVAASRNAGIQQARFEIVLFSQADIIADSNLLKFHLDFHSRYPGLEFGLVGFTTWHPDLAITPLMRWLEKGGPQFNYPFTPTTLANLNTTSPEHKTDFLNFYTTNLSLKRRFVLDNQGFDTNFRGPAGVTAYEDTELGYRLQKKGMQLYYQTQAIAFHKHVKDLKNVLRRRYHEGQIAHLLQQKHPDLKWNRLLTDHQLFFLTILVLNPIIMYPLTQLTLLLQKTLDLPILYKLVTRAYYNWGFLQYYFKKTNQLNG